MCYSTNSGLIAAGVGTSEIIGRIHACKLKIGGKFWIECAVSVLTQIDIDFLLGLDMLKKHRCSIDLASNTLKFPGDAGKEAFEVPFVPDHLITRKGNHKLGDSGIQEGPLTEERKKELIKDVIETTKLPENVVRQMLEENNWDAELVVEKCLAGS